jgi:hypothetical protein
MRVRLVLFYIKKYISVANMFSSKKKKFKRVEADLMWPDQLHGSKNKRTTIKNIVWLKRFQDDIFF